MSFEQKFTAEMNEFINRFLPIYPEAHPYLLAAGKRLRPALFLDYVSAREALSEKHWQVAIGLEMLHLFFLVHDDLMDGDDLRRNFPTIQAVYRPIYGDLKANGIALIIGDLLFSEAVKKITLNSPHPLAAELLFEVINITARGQLNEYVLSLDQPDLLSRLLLFYQEKTALYSFYLPLALAALHLDQPQLLDDLKSLSANLGEAFQINDDLIEFNLEKMRTNNGLSADILRGKVTPLLLWIWHETAQEDRQLWQQQWKNGLLSEENHHRILALGKKIGVDQIARNLIQQNVSQAQEKMQQLNLSNLPSIRSILALFQ